MNKDATGGALAYHVVVNALEARSGWTPMARFAAAVRHAINGHLPYARYHAAGLARPHDGAGESALEAMVHDFIVTDLTAGVVFLKDVRSPDVLTHSFNAYNASARLGVRTIVVAAPQEGLARRPLVARRAAETTADDPPLCKSGTLMLFETLRGQVRRNALGAEGRGSGASIAGVARLLGVEGSAAAEVALVFEREGSMPIADVARALGCHQRTLERRLREAGLTPEMMRMAARLLRATRRLWSPDSLTMIAVEEGYSDLAHMTRAFQAAAGVPPSMLRKLALADAAAIAAPSVRPHV